MKNSICVATSTVNNCGYCLDAHKVLAIEASATDNEITATMEVVTYMSAFNKFIAAQNLTNDITFD